MIALLEKEGTDGWHKIDLHSIPDRFNGYQLTLRQPINAVYNQGQRANGKPYFYMFFNRRYSYIEATGGSLADAMEHFVRKMLIAFTTMIDEEKTMYADVQRFSYKLQQYEVLREYIGCSPAD